MWTTPSVTEGEIKASMLWLLTTISRKLPCSKESGARLRLKLKEIATFDLSRVPRITSTLPPQ